MKNETTIKTGVDLLRRMLAGETLHHGLPPGEGKRDSWWLYPSMAPVTAKAVKEARANTQEVDIQS